MLIGLALLLGLGYAAFVKLRQSNSDSSHATHAPNKTHFSEPTPAPLVPGESAAAIPGTEGDSARISHAEPATETAKDAAEPPVSSPTPDSSTAEASSIQGLMELKLPAGIVITNRASAETPSATAAFMYWVASLTVSGVTNSSPARFLMNGRLVREGDEVNRALEISFERVDPSARLIYFRDKSGAVVTRSY